MNPRKDNQLVAVKLQAPRLAGQAAPSSDLRVGQIAVTGPRFGQLDVYTKADGKRGAKVVCDQDGGRYGVTAGVLHRFPMEGTYAGWAYADLRRAVVFRFLAGNSTSEPPSLLAIAADNELVDVPPSSLRGAAPQHGAFVGFYARRVGAREHPGRLEATRVFPLDSEHVLVIARLIAGGQVRFPDHAAVVDTFFASLGSSAPAASQDADLVAAALVWLAADRSVPGHLQMLARVEQGRVVGGVPETSHRTQSDIPVQPGTTQDAVKPVRAGGSRRRDGVVGDVSAVKFRLE